MEIPSEAPVMILPEVTLFPQALLPLHIFELRYRRMLADALAGNRLFIVAMQKPGFAREVPSNVAGLGMVRVCVENPDGTSHLILQGIQRVELAETVRYKPYRVHTIRPLRTPAKESPQVEALLAKVRDLVTERITLGLSKPSTGTLKKSGKKGPKTPSVKEIIGYLDQLSNPEEVADLVSCALLPGSEQRQTILETIELEPRLQHLIHFLMAEIKQHRKDR